MTQVISLDLDGNLINNTEEKDMNITINPDETFVNILIENGTPSGYEHDERVKAVDKVSPDRIYSYDGRDLIHPDQAMIERDAFKKLQDTIASHMETCNINLVAFAGFGPINLLRRAGLYSLAEWAITEGIPVLFLK